jgi:hypothetical protein
MSYRNRLSPWCIVRHLPDARSIIVARFRYRNEAEAHLRIIRQLLPNSHHSLIFDVILERSTEISTTSVPQEAEIENRRAIATRLQRK